MKNKIVMKNENNSKVNLLWFEILEWSELAYIPSCIQIIYLFSICSFGGVNNFVKGYPVRLTY